MDRNKDLFYGYSQAIQFLQNSSVNKKHSFLFVGMSPSMGELAKQFAYVTQHSYANKDCWKPGMLTNWKVSKNTIRKKQLKHTFLKSKIMEYVPGNSSIANKKKLNNFFDIINSQYYSEFNKSVPGTISLTHRPQIVIVLDPENCGSVIRETQRTGIPTVGVITENIDLNILKNITYPITTFSNDSRVAMLKKIINFVPRN